MRRGFSVGVLAVGLGMIMASAPVWAEEEEKKESWLPGGLAGNVGVVTDYSFRGISQTGRDHALQGGLDWTHDTGIHLGLWASNTSFGKTYIEQDLYGGYAGSIDDFSYDVLATFFFYPKDEQFNYWEFALNMGYDFKVAKLTAGMVGSPDYFGILGTGFYASGGVNVPLPLDIPYFDLALDAKGGYSTAETAFAGTDKDYGDWSAALQVALPFNLALDFRYIGTDIKKSEYGNNDAGDRFVFGAKYSF